MQFGGIYSARKMILNGSLSATTIPMSVLSNSVQMSNRSTVTTTTTTASNSQHVRLVQLVLDATKVRKAAAVSAAVNLTAVSPPVANTISSGKFTARFKITMIWFYF